MNITFKQFVTNESLTQTWSYRLPSNKEEQMFDFYMLTMLSNKTQNKTLNAYVNECRNILLPSLKEELLKDVFFSISQEIRHYPDKIHVHHSKKKLKDILNEKQIKAIEKFQRNIEVFGDALLTHRDRIEDFYKNHLDDEKYEDIFLNSDEEKNQLIVLISSLKTELTEKQFVEICKKLFDPENIFWEPKYGGKKWYEICKGWLNLYNAKTLNNIMIWIDHIYDLEHNTGSLFDKLNSYRKNKSWDWIRQSLDLKKDIKSPVEIIDKVSPKMKILARPVLYEMGVRPLEQKDLYIREKILPIKEKIRNKFGKDATDILFSNTNPTLLELIERIRKNNDEHFINEFLPNINNIKNMKLTLPSNVEQYILFKKEDVSKMLFINDLYKLYPKDIENTLIRRDCYAFYYSGELNIENVKDINKLDKIFIDTTGYTTKYPQEHHKKGVSKQEILLTNSNIMYDINYFNELKEKYKKYIKEN